MGSREKLNLKTLESRIKVVCKMAASCRWIWKCFSFRQSAAVKHCSVMTDGAAFEPCRRVLDPEPYIKQCKYDVCSCGLSDQSDVTACSAMAAYAHECRKYLNESHTVDTVSGWRVETGSEGFFDCSSGNFDQHLWVVNFSRSIYFSHKDMNGIIWKP